LRTTLLRGEDKSRRKGGEGKPGGAKHRNGKWKVKSTISSPLEERPVEPKREKKV